MPKNSPQNSLPHSTFIRWLPLAALLTGMIGIVYVAVQQSYRQGANDPQVQMAEDAAAMIREGAMPTTVVGTQHINLNASLSPFISVTDLSGKVVASNGYIDGQQVALPRGVISFTTEHGQDRVTWQPQAGLRFAVVAQTTGTKSGYVVAVGRSLREVELRVTQLSDMMGLAWIVGLAGLALIVFVIAAWERSRQE